MKNFKFRTFEEFNIKPNNLMPAGGRILISEPFLLDVIFKRTVVLLVEHNEEGSFGFILNRPLGLKLNDIFSDFPKIDAELYLGGPVSKETLFFIHSLGNKITSSYKVTNNIWFGGNIFELKELISLGEVNPHEIKFFLGYSGWGKNQLMQEMNENSWVVSNPIPELILTHDTKELWQQYLKQMGSYYYIWTKFPKSPILN